MTDEEALERYGQVPLYFSHYYNFVFVYKSAVLEDGERVFLHLGGSMEQVSAMVVDAEVPMTLEEDGDDEYAYVKDADKQTLWTQGDPPD
ncbi:MAG: hypothetical protein G3M78_04435 [Candidatus Nitrohelix vancouverensis]|uniref:Uncharacterized protein n=1 Tax=Candidatus Nitrohelix vancouverensis TaxID=2705534 RepID=A0A7T0C189_9BACT|nr:MAG: hypothetical protein G3M78_04435 [Candidatus Nitrohelix vancouverensis]